MQGGNGERDDDRRAVRIRHDRTGPAAALPLQLQQRQLIGVDLRDQERHVGIHAMVACIAEHDPPSPREGLLDLARHTGIEGGEDDRRIDRRRIAGHHRERAHVRGHGGADPAGGVGVRASSAAFRRGHGAELEPRMVVKQPDEGLSHGAGRAEHADFHAAPLLSHFASSSERTIFT